MLSKSSKWELGLVHYISKFTISRFVISRFECTTKSKGRWLTSLNGFLDKEFDTLSIKNTNILVRKLGKQLQKSVTRSCLTCQPHDVAFGKTEVTLQI